MPPRETSKRAENVIHCVVVVVVVGEDENVYGHTKVHWYTSLHATVLARLLFAHLQASERESIINPRCFASGCTKDARLHYTQCKQYCSGTVGGAVNSQSVGWLRCATRERVCFSCLMSRGGVCVAYNSFVCAPYERDILCFRGDPLNTTVVLWTWWLKWYKQTNTDVIATDATDESQSQGKTNSGRRTECKKKKKKLLYC